MVFFRSIYLLVLVTSTFLSADGANYGVDCSFPIHSTDLQCGDLLGDRKAVYEEFMQGCREKWGEKGAKRCDSSDMDRLEMSRRQPQSMVVSSLYTSVLHSMMQALTISSCRPTIAYATPCRTTPRPASKRSKLRSHYGILSTTTGTRTRVSHKDFEVTSIPL
jgi:hypothetical protein